MRIIKMHWTKRNVERMTRCVNLTYDFKGYIYRDGQVIGFKTANDGREIAFLFYEKATENMARPVPR